MAKKFKNKSKMCVTCTKILSRVFLGQKISTTSPNMALKKIKFL